MRRSDYETAYLIRKSKIPSIDYAAPPVQLRFRLRLLLRQLQRPVRRRTSEGTGNLVAVKSNAVKLARSELGRMQAAKKNGMILLSSLTDLCEGIERRRGIAGGVFVSSSAMGGRASRGS
ncbi:hypothetical protein C8N35_1011138 [Breoghania corrubedonensis]|uniref:Uncharacterized protein n=1 Tax=Breoghania corrubedonensis TaxID=665038 RepID=A0A2T5VH69_9HYPH|nr:hypothetical protein [Breoghania corrubedonensis]PTW63088.1 hypothetical protein C8N35_1011138 [Breoghania corrubedonensis]